MRNSQATRLLLVFSLAVGLLAGITLSLPQTSHAAELDTETWAVIIGVADYQNLEPQPVFPSAWETYDLSYSDDSARRLEMELTPKCGADHVRVLLDSIASKAGVESAILDWLAPNEDSDDTVLVYFSGHGNAEYLCPWDSLDWSDSNDISYSTFDGWLDVLDSQRVGIVLESCESGGYGAHLEESGRVVIAASDADESAWAYGALESGVLSYYLVEGLEQISLTDTNGNHGTSLEEMFRYAQPKVVSYCAQDGISQHPQIFDAFAGELELFAMVTVTFDVSYESVSLTVDGIRWDGAQLPARFTWFPGTSHSVSAAPTVEGGEGTKYVFTSWSDGIKTPSRTVTAAQTITLGANYTRQYRLTVSTEYGTAHGGGWYDEGSEAEIWVEGGTAWYRAFAGWEGDIEAGSNDVRILVGAPTTQAATWKLSVYFWLVVFGGAASVLVLLAFALTRRRHPLPAEVSPVAGGDTNEAVLLWGAPESSVPVTVNAVSSPQPRTHLTITPRAAEQLRAVQAANSRDASHVLRIRPEADGFSLWLGPEQAGDILVGSEETVVLRASPEFKVMLQETEVVVDCVDGEDGQPRLMVYPEDGSP